MGGTFSQNKRLQSHPPTIGIQGKITLAVLLIITFNTSITALEHCVKSVQILSYFGSVFSCIRSVFSPNTGKYGPEIAPYLDTFHVVEVILILFSTSNYYF